MNILFKNNATSFLTSAITDTQDSFEVDDGSVFPEPLTSEYFYCTLASNGTNEIIKVNEISGSTFLNVERGQDNTTALLWNSGSLIELRLNAGNLNDITSSVEFISSSINLELNETNSELNNLSGSTYTQFENTTNYSASIHTEIETNITNINSLSGSTYIQFETTNNDINELSGSVYVQFDNINDISGSIHDRLELDDIIHQSINTGFINGLNLSINTDTTKFDISSGSYFITDYTIPSSPRPVLITYLGSSENTPEFLASANATYVGLDVSGNVVSSVIPFTTEQRRSICSVGAVIHSNRTNINVINQIKSPVLGDTNQLHDLIKAIGTLNISGNIYSANGSNLSLDKSAGVIFGLGINSNDYTNPHSLTISDQTGLTFRYRLQDSTEYPDSTLINPTQYDLNGVLTTVDNKKFTIQRINLFQSGLTRIQYGQNQYGSLEEAMLYINTEPFVTEANIADNAVFRCYLVLKKNVTDLSAGVIAETVKFVPVDKFGNTIGGVGIALTSNAIITALGYTPENIGNKVTSISGTSTDTQYPSAKLLYDQLALKQNPLTGSITGSLKQVSITSNTNSVSGNLILTLPQDIATDSNVQFGSLTAEIISPVSDSTGSIYITKADGITPIIRVDSIKGNVEVSGSLTSNLNVITKDPSGFTDPENIIVTYDSINRTITLTGNVEAYWQGKLIPSLVSGWVSDPHDVTPTNYFLYYNGTDFVWDTDPWTFDLVQIAFVSISGYGLRECHGTMPYNTHSELHNTIGCFKSAGGTFSNYVTGSSTATDRRPYISSTTLNDEDLTTINSELITNSYTIRTLTSTATVNFVTGSTEIVPLSGNHPYYNQYSGSIWQQTLMSDRYYQTLFVLAVPVTSDTLSQNYRYQFIQGQSETASLTYAQSLTKNDVNLGAIPTLVPESFMIGKIIIQYIDSNWIIKQVYTHNFGINLKQPVSIPYLVNTYYVGEQGHFTKLNDCITWLSIPGNMIANTDIIFDGSGDTIEDTIVINLPYNLTLYQSSSGNGTLRANTGLTNKPMFSIYSECYIYGMIFDATTLTDYGTLSTENCFDVISGIYIEVQNSIITGFYKQINMLGDNSELFYFNSISNNAINSGICVNATGSTAIDVETNTFNDCKYSLHLLKSSDGTVNFINNILDSPSGSTAILYTPGVGNFIPHTHNSISSNIWNNVGEFYSGFDFSRSDSRDANIYLRNNLGKEDKKPHAKINVVNNALPTIITTGGTYYKANFINTSFYTCKFTVADNRLTYQPLNPTDIKLWIAGSIQINEKRDLNVCIRKDGIATNISNAIIRPKGDNDPTSFSMVAYIEDMNINDYIEIFVMSTNNNDEITITDCTIFAEAL